MAARIAIFLVVGSLIFGSAHRYVWARLVRDAALPPPWTRIGTITIVVLFLVLMLAMISSRFLPRNAGQPLAWVAFTWLGVLFFLVLALGVSDLARFLTVRPSMIEDPARRQLLARFFAGGAALVGLSLSGAGVVSALSSVAVKRVKVAIDGLRDEGLRIVQISDVHIGPTIGKTFLAEIVAHINGLAPDAVVITGDLVDGSVAELEEHVAPLADLKAKHGVFFVTGNHEYYSGADAWIAHLAKLGVRTLRNERVAIGGIDLAGIDDHSASGGGHGSDLPKALLGRDPSRPCVLLAHQPRGIELADELGVDLQLSGHTHGGQLFPWNFMVRLQQPFVAGLHKLRKAQIYVSRGTGYWGPPMRVGAPAEITEVELVKAIA